MQFLLVHVVMWLTICFSLLLLFICVLYTHSVTVLSIIFFYYSDSVKEVNLFDSFCVEFLSIVCDCSKYS